MRGFWTTTSSWLMKSTGSRWKLTCWIRRLKRQGLRDKSWLTYRWLARHGPGLSQRDPAGMETRSKHRLTGWDRKLWGWTMNSMRSMMHSTRWMSKLLYWGLKPKIWWLPSNRATMMRTKVAEGAPQQWDVTVRTRQANRLIWRRGRQWPSLCRSTRTRQQMKIKSRVQATQSRSDA